MKKVKVYEFISSISIVLGCIFMCGSTNNLAYGFVSVLLLINAWGYSELAIIKRNNIANQMYEGTGND